MIDIKIRWERFNINDENVSVCINDVAPPTGLRGQNNFDKSVSFLCICLIFCTFVCNIFIYNSVKNE